MALKNFVVVSFAFFVGYLYMKKSDDVINNDVIEYDVAEQTAPKLDGEHVEIFKEPKVIKVTRGVFVAVGFALGNSIMIEGTDGIIIVDTTESSESMINIMTEFRKITKKPLKAVIVTHFHTDHVVGTKELLELEGNNQTEVYGHKMTVDIMLAEPNIEVAFYRRVVRQFGFGLEKDNAVGAGIGMDIKLANLTRWGRILPTVTYEGRKSYTVAGISFELIHTPGETPDQTSVWIPSLRTYLPADNIYKCFPNLYAIRGSPSRNTKHWYESIDVARDLKPLHLVPSHTDPISGEREVYDVLTVYRDAIKFIHDQTIRYINKGWFPNEIADHLRLPQSIESHPFLNQYYGTVEWSVRGVFDHYLGWFSGDPVDLIPLSTKKQALKTALLLASDTEGSVASKIKFGVKKMLNEAQKSLLKSHENMQTLGHPLCDEDKWALTLARDAMYITDKDSPLHSSAVSMKIRALYSLHLCTTSANGRHYFLVSAMEEEGKMDIEPTMNQVCLTSKLADLHILLKMLALRLDNTKCNGFNFTSIYKFVDNPSQPFYIALSIRNCVCDVIENPPPSTKSSADLVLSIQSSSLREMFCGKPSKLKTSTLSAFSSGAIEINKGDIYNLRRFLNFFE